MEAPDVTEMPLRAGHLALDFINTVDDDLPGGDYLRSDADVAAFFAHVGLDGAAPLREAVRVRAQIDAVLRPLARGEDAPGSALEALRRRELAGLGRATLRPGGWETASALDTLVHAAVELVLRGPLERLRVCGHCTWLFLDLTRNGSRRWCSMQSCGNVVKARRLTARRRARG